MEAWDPSYELDLEKIIHFRADFTSKFLNGTPVMPLQRYRFYDIFDPKKRGTTATTIFPVARGGRETANPVRMAIVSWTGVQKTLNIMLREKNFFFGFVMFRPLSGP